MSTIDPSHVNSASPLLQTWPLPKDVAATDPVNTMVMQGFAPPPELRVNAQNWVQFPQSRWAVRHGSMFMPTDEVLRSGPVSELHQTPQSLGSIRFNDLHGHSRSLDEFLACSYIDGFMVLHRGKLIFQNYPGSMQPWERHTLASITKSVTALLVLMLADEGLLQLHAKLSTYVPELSGTPIGGVSLQENLDMAVAIEFPTDRPYNFGYWAAASAFTQVSGAHSTVYDFISQTGKAVKVQGPVMQYQNNSPEALNWALQRITGKSWQTLLHEKIWSKLGAERDAYTVVDGAGMPLGAGGLYVTLSDLARFGAMLCNEGDFNGQQIVRRNVIEQLFGQGHNHEAFASGNMAQKSAASGVKYTYRNYWYQTNGDYPAFQAHGILSQYLHVAPQDELVIAQLASTPFEGGVNLPSFNRAAIAITQALRK